MKLFGGFVGLVAALGTGYYVYSTQLSHTGTAAGGLAPRQQIDVTAIRASLLEIGQAQRIYVNAHGAYGTLEQLRANGARHMGVDQRGYTFSVQPDGARGFVATASPAGVTGTGWPTLRIDEKMEVTQQ